MRATGTRPSRSTPGKSNGTRTWIISTACRAVLGAIDLDPASSKVAQKTVKANRYFTRVEDALDREWHGRIFMNPPYCRDGMPRFAEKLIVEFRAGRFPRPSPSSIPSRTQAGFMTWRAVPRRFGIDRRPGRLSSSEAQDALRDPLLGLIKPGEKHALCFLDAVFHDCLFGKFERHGGFDQCRRDFEQLFGKRRELVHGKAAMALIQRFGERVRNPGPAPGSWRLSRCQAGTRSRPPS